MHNVQNLCGYIGHLMKLSGLETNWRCLWGSATSWGKGNHGPVQCEHSGWYPRFCYKPSYKLTSSRGSRYVSTWRRHVCSADSAPTGRHWVDNLITPTLLAHQFLRSEREGYSIVILLHSWSPPLCQISLVALPRDVCPA